MSVEVAAERESELVAVEWRWFYGDFVYFYRQRCCYAIIRAFVASLVDVIHARHVTSHINDDITACR